MPVFEEHGNRRACRERRNERRKRVDQCSLQVLAPQMRRQGLTASHQQMQIERQEGIERRINRPDAFDDLT